MARGADLDELIVQLAEQRTLGGTALLPGVAAQPNERWADAVELGIWITGHLRDLPDHVAAATVSIPDRDLERFDCAPAMLGRAPTPTPVRRLVRFEGARARGYLAAGPMLVAATDGLRRRIRTARRVATSEAVLDRLAALDHDPFARPVRPRSCRVVSRTAKILRAASRVGNPRA